MVYLGNEFRQASYELDRLLRLPREISPTDADWLCLEEKIAQYAKWQPEEADRVRDILSKQWGRQSVREAA